MCVCTCDNSLPELSDRGGKVGDVGCQPHCLVLADRVLYAALRVPGLLAFGPGKLRLKALEQVVESPGQDHDVVDVQKRHDHERGIADTWRGDRNKEDITISTRNQLTTAFLLLLFVRAQQFLREPSPALAMNRSIMFDAMLLTFLSCTRCRAGRDRWVLSGLFLFRNSFLWLKTTEKWAWELGEVQSQVIVLDLSL